MWKKSIIFAEIFQKFYKKAVDVGERRRIMGARWFDEDSGIAC